MNFLKVLEAEVAPPFPVLIRFVPTGDATINLDTLKVKYKFLDVTERVTGNMTVTPAGIEGHIDAVKAGKYKFKVSISDNQDRTGRATFTFRVTG